MGKSFSKRLFKDNSTSMEDIKYCWILEGFPELHGELPLNGMYEYIGDYQGFASYHITQGKTKLYVDQSDGYWALSSVREEGHCAAYSAEGKWLKEPPSTGWVVSRRYLGGDRGFGPCTTAVVKEPAERKVVIIDLYVAGFPEDSDLNGIYEFMGRSERWHTEYYQRKNYYLFHIHGIWCIHKGGFEPEEQLAFSTQSSSQFQPIIPPSRGWALGRVIDMEQSDSDLADVIPLSTCIAFIPRPRPPPRHTDTPPPCEQCGTKMEDWDSLVRHRQLLHQAQGVCLPCVPLVHIFGFVPYHALGNMALVCSTWHQVYCGDPFWATTAEHVFPFFNWAQSFCILECECECIGTGAEAFYASTRPPEGKVDDGSLSMYTKFQQVVRGQRTCLVQVFDKHVRDGFKMTVYDAFLFFRSRRWWNVYYLQPVVPRSDESRCYFAAELVEMDRLRRLSADCDAYNPYEPHFPCGLTHTQFTLGLDVEIQYRFREEDPYGWWKGVVKECKCRPDGQWEVLVHFPQYKDNPKWATETVILGQKNLKPVAFMKQQSVGGIRICSAEQKGPWASRQRVWQF